MKNKKVLYRTYFTERLSVRGQVNWAFVSYVLHLMDVITKPYYELLKSFLCNTGLITFSIYVSRDIYLGIAY